MSWSSFVSAPLNLPILIDRESKPFLRVFCAALSVRHGGLSNVEIKSLRCLVLNTRGVREFDVLVSRFGMNRQNWCRGVSLRSCRVLVPRLYRNWGRRLIT